MVLNTIGLISSVAATVALMGCSYHLYDSDEFSGDATIEDRGAWSAVPRWTITFPEISLEREEIHVFRMDGAPKYKLHFGLRPLRSTMKPTLSRTDASVEVTVRDDQGTVIFTGGGQLNGQNWRHSEPQYEYYLRQADSLATYRTDRSYMIEVAVTKAGDLDFGLVVVPVLYGGGSELVF